MSGRVPTRQGDQSVSALKSAEVCQSAPDDQAAIAQLLYSTFGGAPRLLSPELLQWKFFSGRTDSTASRSYVFREDGKIQAHAAEWPLSFLTPSGEISSCHVIDWAARPEAKGTGVRVYQHLMEKNETLIAIGGTARARELRPLLGFQPHGAVDFFARTVRPWRQYRSRPQRAGMRDLARLARNCIWNSQPLAAPEANWQIVPISDVRRLPLKALRVKTSTMCLGVRTPSWLRYIMDCPVMECSLFVLAKAGVMRGHFLLNQVAGQCRIIDLAVESEEPADWVSAYSAAVSAALRDPRTCEILMASSLPWLSDAMREMGFRLRKRSPVMVYDPSGRLMNGPPLCLQMTDSDACFLYDEDYPFWT